MKGDPEQHVQAIAELWQTRHHHVHGAQWEEYAIDNEPQIDNRHDEHVYFVLSFCIDARLLSGILFGHCL